MIDQAEHGDVVKLLGLAHEGVHIRLDGGAGGLCAPRLTGVEQRQQNDQRNDRRQQHAADNHDAQTDFVKTCGHEREQLRDAVDDADQRHTGAGSHNGNHTQHQSDDGQDDAQENDTEFVYTPIGYDAFVFFVHKDNPIDSLTRDQVRSLYSGAITNWSQVGGHDEEIVAYQRNEGSGSQSRLIRFMGDTPLMEPPIDAQIDTMMGITQNVAQFRSSTASIGFSFRYYMEALVANPDLKLLAIDGIAPTAENIASGTYPLTGYLYAVSWEGNENENVQKLLDWVLSPEGQYIIAETGYVPIGPTE